MRIYVKHDDSRTETIADDADEIKAMEDAISWLHFEIMQRKAKFGGVPN